MSAAPIPVYADYLSLLDPNGEPVVIAHAVTVILCALVTAGWVAIPSPTIDTIGTIAGALLGRRRARSSPGAAGEGRRLVGNHRLRRRPRQGRELARYSIVS